MFSSREQPPLCPTSTYYRLPILTDDDTVSPGSCVGECSSTFEILLHQGVHAHGSLALGASCPVRIAKKYNVAASSCMGFKPPQPKRKRLCRLFSSVALFSATNEDYEYRVYRPLGSRDTFIVSIAVPRN